MSVSEATTAFTDAINNITATYTSCSGYSDVVSASHSYEGTTTYESDMNSSGDCTLADGVSSWDAGNLPAGTVAQTCWVTIPQPGRNTLIEADVRFNTTDHNFSDGVQTGCTNKYDVRAVGTHEAGHVFGLDDLTGNHEELTMFGTSFKCNTKARTLGKGDILGLDEIY